MVPKRVENAAFRPQLYRTFGVGAITEIITGIRTQIAAIIVATTVDLAELSEKNL